MISLPQFLILCEKVLGFKGGKEVFHEPASGFKKVDFGESIGEKTVGGAWRVFDAHAAPARAKDCSRIRTVSHQVPIVADVSRSKQTVRPAAACPCQQWWCNQHKCNRYTGGCSGSRSRFLSCSLSLSRARAQSRSFFRVIVLYLGVQDEPDRVVHVQPGPWHPQHQHVSAYNTSLPSVSCVCFGPAYLFFMYAGPCASKATQER